MIVHKRVVQQLSGRLLLAAGCRKISIIQCVVFAISWRIFAAASTISSTSWQVPQEEEQGKEQYTSPYQSVCTVYLVFRCTPVQMQCKQRVSCRQPVKIG